ncbi:DUF2206 domain-containing protein [Streptacidiphilus sp. EB129]|uniref:DUF2206 domain-containing protein n=1 Tax=Streptacidiphilus sp. EB129 TaxID=3156262 RepID=UPI0035177FC6
MTLPFWARGRSGLLCGITLTSLLELAPGVPAVPFTMAGLWLLFGAPTLLWRGVASRAVSRRDSSLLLALGLAVITDLLVALLLNTVLPLVGMVHPLTRVPLAGASGMALIALGALLPEEEREKPEQRASGRGAPQGLFAVAALGSVTLVLSVAGAIRLNNGLSGAVSTVALTAVAALLVLLMVRRRRYPAEVLEFGLFLAAAALLLLTSLRGWFITGHDIQREYQVFQLAYQASRWNVGSLADAYNACLSITLLPAEVARLTAIPGVYVFKVLFPLLFALTPVLVYRSVRNVAPQFVALLSAVYFMAFPTFFTDMTFLGRQEIAFLLLGCAMVVLTDAGRPLRLRRLIVTVLLAGIVLSHYSTTYVVVATLGLGLAADLLWRLAGRRGAGSGGRRRTGRAQAQGFVTWWMVAASAVLALVWAGPVTHTSGQLQSTLTQSLQDILHPGHSQGGSSDTSYSLFGGGAVSPDQRLSQYRTETEQLTAAQRARGERIPLKVVNTYQTVAVPQPNQPLTAAGQVLQSTGLDVVAANGFVRQALARLLQVLLLAGVVVTVRWRRKGFRPTRDQLTLTVGAVGLIAVLTVLPQLSVDYGVLRAFQQGLFFFAPFIAAGTLWALRWAGRRSTHLVCAAMAAMFLDLTGVVPQLLGGYPGQLNLSNSGQYYDIYYDHPEERTAMAWLLAHTAADPATNGQSEIQTDRFTFDRLQTMIDEPNLEDIYPTLLSSYSYVFLGTTTVQTGQVTISYRGDLVTYQYPVTLLDLQKDQIYSSEGASIYR